MKLRDIEVNISVADSSEHLAQYGIDEQDGRTIGCYIASEAGKTFVINVYNGLQGKTVIADCYMDGDYANGKFAEPGDWSELRGVYISVSESVAMERVFTFADIQVTDDENAENDAQDLGFVEVRVYRIVMGECWAPDASAETWVGSDKPVNELSKKAGLHRIVLADAAPVATRDYHDYTFMDGEKDPYVTFRFMYRPREILKAQGIIPLSPSPETDNTDCVNSNTRQAQKNDNNGVQGVGVVSNTQSHSQAPSPPEAGLSSAPQRAGKRRASDSTMRTREQSKATKRPRQASPEEDVKRNLDHVGLHIAHNFELDNASITSAQQILRYVRTQLGSAKRDLAEKEIVRYLSAQLENAERDLAATKEQRGGRDSLKRKQADKGVLAFSSAVIDLTLD
ncbi:uncharacterized protein C8Q71DRAFT_874465 [Rhodofomes roseus]|uniref:DUF7918 domain-containing protein n=1 Tax=Rhodofomes roseus TaxID=34475 RepID=A0ABQ8K925_9APHY|nr:uncharacterized protein C8Q71DRAFT_874465 [Rhodofomes roseus]KAH9833785.1 hypothetical protein C8Q71DRAFT_874465 [Rhodofomes roseus]